jgi:hypothetical protein
MPGHYLIILSPSECGAKGRMFQRELSALCRVQVEEKYMMVAKADLPHVKCVASNVFGLNAIKETPF